MKKIIRIIALFAIVFNINTVIAQETEGSKNLKVEKEAVNANEQTEIEVPNKFIIDTSSKAIGNKECAKDCKKACCVSKTLKEGTAEGKVACKPGCEKACCAASANEKKKTCCKSKKSCKKTKEGTASACDSKKKKCKKACEKKEKVS